MTASASPTPHHVVAIPRHPPLHNVYSCMTFFVREHPDLHAAIVSAERIYASMSQDPTRKAEHLTSRAKIENSTFPVCRVEVSHGDAKGLERCGPTCNDSHYVSRRASCRCSKDWLFFPEGGRP